MGSSSSKPARKLATQTSTRITRPTAATSTPAASPSSAAAAPPAGTAAQGHSLGNESPSSLAEQVGRAVGGSRPRPPNAAAGGAGFGAESNAAVGAASEGRDANIVRDGKDPQLLQHLATLGPVKVARNRLTYRPTDQMLGILAARQRETDLEESSTIPASSSNAQSSPSSSKPSQSGVSSERISATSLAQFFDDRKACRTRADVERLALEYDLGIELVDKLVLRFNTASLGEPVDALHNAADSSPHSEEENAERKEGPQRIHGIWEEPRLVDQKQIQA